MKYLALRNLGIIQQDTQRPKEALHSFAAVRGAALGCDSRVGRVALTYGFGRRWSWTIAT